MDCLQTLNEDFLKKLMEAFEIIKGKGFELRPFYCRRDPWEQAKLWRQSRTKDTIERTIGMLKRSNAEYLAQILEEVGPQSGRWATNAIPGASHHQYGNAIDCFVLDPHSGKAIWNPNNPGYQVYAEAATSVGLESGYFWSKKDMVHCQLNKDRMTDLCSWREINNLISVEYPQRPIKNT